MKGLVGMQSSYDVNGLCIAVDLSSGEEVYKEEGRLGC